MGKYIISIYIFSRGLKSWQRTRTYRVVAKPRNVEYINSVHGLGMSNYIYHEHIVGGKTKREKNSKEEGIRKRNVRSCLYKAVSHGPQLPSAEAQPRLC